MCCTLVHALQKVHAKRQKFAMSFKHVGALDVRVNFFISPAAFDEVVHWVVRGLIVMVKPDCSFRSLDIARLGSPQL